MRDALGRGDARLAWVIVPYGHCIPASVGHNYLRKGRGTAYDSPSLGCGASSPGHLAGHRPELAYTHVLQNCMRQHAANGILAT